MKWIKRILLGILSLYLFALMLDVFISKSLLKSSLYNDELKTWSVINNDILDKLRQTKIDKNYWGNCQSALRAYLYFLQHKGSDSITFPDEEINFIEGSCVEVKVNRYERDLTARSECIKIHLATCKVCDFNFYEKYGDIGKGFIHVHHIIPISQIGSSYKINPKNDLIPVCPNCHAMLHTRNPALFQLRVGA